jgi:hypothetical protein
MFFQTSPRFDRCFTWLTGEWSLAMSLRLKIIKRTEYLAVNFSGAGTVDEMSRHFVALAEQCRAAKKNRLLINVSAIHADPSFSERYRAGERAVVFASQGIKIALVGTPDQVDPGLLGELVARNRGVDGRVFTSLAAAKKWLLEKPES